MKTKLVNLWKNVVEFVSMMFGFGAIVAITAIAMAVVSVVSNFMATHQWVILMFDVTCVVLLTMAIRYRLDRNFQTSKGKWLFWLLFSNVLILIIQSFGALWNFLIVLFVLWPLSIMLSQLIEGNFRNFWWLLDKKKFYMFLLSFFVSLLVMGFLYPSLSESTSRILAIIFVSLTIILTVLFIYRLRKK